MGMVDHPNVIKLFQIFDESKRMNLVMELVTGGELFDRIVVRTPPSQPLPPNRPSLPSHYLR